MARSPRTAGPRSDLTIPGVSHTTVVTNGLTFRVALAGSGPPLVLLHGWPQNWWCWRYTIPMLADRFRLIMPDLRGHGWTDAPASGYDKEQLATDVLELLDELELDRVMLVGHDWGGWVGFLAALRAPERFSSLLALGVVHPFQRATPATLAQAWRGAYQVLLSTPAVGQAMLRSSPRFVEGLIRLGSSGDAISRDDRRTYAEIFQEPDRARAAVQLYRTFLLSELPRLRRYHDQRLSNPTRLIVGEHDPVATGPLLDGWQRNAPDMTVEVLPDVAHFLPEEAPVDVVGHIEEMHAAHV